MNLVNALLLFLGVFFVSVTVLAQSGIKVRRIGRTELPKGIKYTGSIKESIQFTDKSGDHLVLTTETGIYQNNSVKHEEDGSDAELYAYHYLVQGDTITETWRVYDYIHDCPLDMEAAFIKNTFQVTDLNKDGVAEVWLMYKTVCRGDVSPSDMKIIMYQGKQKFSMRGQNKVQVSDKEFDGGDYKLDWAFTNGPKEFREFAQRMWNNNTMEIWEK